MASLNKEVYSFHLLILNFLPRSPSGCTRMTDKHVCPRRAAPGHHHSLESYSKLSSAVHSCFPFLQKLTVNLNNLPKTEEDSQSFFSQVNASMIVNMGRAQLQIRCFSKLKQTKRFQRHCRQVYRRIFFLHSSLNINSFIHFLTHYLIFVI